MDQRPAHGGSTADTQIKYKIRHERCLGNLEESMAIIHCNCRAFGLRLQHFRHISQTSSACSFSLVAFFPPQKHTLHYICAVFTTTYMQQKFVSCLQSLCISLTFGKSTKLSALKTDLRRFSVDSSSFGQLWWRQIDNAKQNKHCVSF